MPESKAMGYKEQALRLCVDQVDGNKIQGRVFSMRLAVPVAFGDLSDFILKMDAVMDAQNFPQSFQRKRAFKKAGDDGLKGDAKAAVEGTGMSEAEVEAAVGLVDTFTVRVVTRQNASWQGHVEIPDGAPIPFDSALEMAAIVVGLLEGRA